MSRLTKSCAFVSLGLSALGLLLIFEVIRPFRDLAIDGPIALTCWGTGALLGAAGFFLRGRSILFSGLGLALNLLPLFGAFVLWLLLRNSNFLWH